MLFDQRELTLLVRQVLRYCVSPLDVISDQIRLIGLTR